MTHNEEWDKPVVHLCPNYFLKYFRDNDVPILNEEAFVGELLNRVNIATWEIATDVLKNQYHKQRDHAFDKASKILSRVRGEKVNIIK